MVQFEGLSNREGEVVECLLQGKSNKQIALSLSISDRTVEFHLKNIYAKYQVNSRTELILKLGNTPGTVKPEKLGNSTVDSAAESPQNGDGFNSGMDWATSSRDTDSITGQELEMQDSLKSDTHNEGNTPTFYQSILVCLIKYADFNGRASRLEFWWFALFVMLVASALLYVSEAWSGVFQVAMLLPLLAVGTRRLHDIGKSGWWQLFVLVPVGGIITLMILWAMPSTNEPGDDNWVG